MGHQVEQPVAENQKRTGKPARQLPQRRVELRGVVGIDHAQHRLGPREVDPSAEERTQGELAGLSVPGTAAQALGKQRSRIGAEHVV